MNKEIEYEINEYVRKYAEKHKITIEEARQHAMCVMTQKYYEKGQNK